MPRTTAEPRPPRYGTWRRSSPAGPGAEHRQGRRLRRPRQGPAYYEPAVAQGEEDYYAGRGEARGEWLGRGAGALGLEGQLSDGDLAELLEWRSPESGAAIVRRPSATGESGRWPRGRARCAAMTSPSARRSPSRSSTASARPRSQIRCARPTTPPSPTRSATSSARRAPRAAGATAASACGARDSWPRPFATAPQEPATPSFTPTSCAPT